MDQFYQTPSHSSTHNMNKYWIPHKDIHKKVIMTHIQSYLGSEATVRSYTKDGEDGFLITTPGACLTDEQIDDICNKSMEMWERQAAARMLASDGTSALASSTSPKAPLKRPLHQPVVIARASSRMSGSPSSDGRSRRSSSHSHRSPSASSSSHHHHHSRHNHNHGHGHSHIHGYPRPQNLPYQPLQQQRQLPRSQQQLQQQQQDAPQQQLAPQQHQQQPFYAQQHHYHHRPSSSHSQRSVHPYHTGWVPLSPTQDGLTADFEGHY